MLTGWKTFLVAIATAIFGALEALDFTQFLTEDNAGYATLGISLVMMVLRSVTKTAAFKAD